MIDIHAHILPGVDDGPSDWEETERLLELAGEQGIHHIIATPHYTEETDGIQLSELLSKTAHILQKGKYDLQLSLGQEILYFEDLPEYLDRGRALTLAESRYVLVEFAPEASFSFIRRAARQLLGCGYLPVLAHVERYACLYEKGRLEELIRGGAYMQMNYHSLEGSVISSGVRWCRRQVLRGNVHFLGTDMHHAEYRTPVIDKAKRWLKQHAGEELFRELTETNPSHILENIRMDLQ